jgi:hypothetical protein
MTSASVALADCFFAFIFSIHPWSQESEAFTGQFGSAEVPSPCVTTMSTLENEPEWSSGASCVGWWNLPLSPCREKVIVVTAPRSRPLHTKDDNSNADSDQTPAYCGLGHSRREHRGAAHRRRVAPIPLDRDPDRARAAGVRRAGCQWRQVPAVRLGPAVHRQPRKQFRHLPAKLASSIQQSHFWSTLCRLRIGRPRMLAHGEIYRIISTSTPLILSDCDPERTAESVFFGHADAVARLTITTPMSDIETEWTWNASLTRSSSYRECSKRRILGR